MNQTKIFPAIDIINGDCVRLSKGDYSTSKVYDNNPLDVAIKYFESGAAYLHVVDLDAAKNPEKNNRAIISSIITKTKLRIQTGGGIRTEKDVEQLLQLGAYRLIIGSVAVTKRKEVISWIKKYGSDCIVIGADVKGGKIATHGWLNVSDESIEDFMKFYINEGATNFLCTDIAKDGMLSGSSIKLYSDLLKLFPEVGLIASGGVTTLDEITKLVEMGVESIIVGKAIYEGKINVSELFRK
ncbi:MAG: 1-(5-phosphoribosyl)-5-[(5-phosphoribosylamino)methylideneamino]imidazole-4-carboxamide isomerase [Saprospiraceae bacterium]|jgi:phosphoribosylformimino-5-aminoimidazole carboxamide ribotide isomerase|nr:1-(5-phosphoribosyl)-5-[(5-phosphoribosylamino)methylideneamino]imidazole-4-carboxamide isomerase [Saprospiraceae bacterium]MBL0025369.1 1-(5-phosphoribosyl)-5-[(5-phosphoribosylamino)methylideneamino]imidazole-4-carboxamide isomerase [Saprospiraceae bacterium]